MKLISHRGNIDHINPSRENSPDYIQEAINKGFDVEIDCWVTNHTLYLGHDKPDYPITLEWLHQYANNLWIHCKNLSALSMLLPTNLRVFFHEHERYSIVSDGHIWAHDIKDIDTRCIIPLLDQSSLLKWAPQPVYGICSDFIGLYTQGA